MSNDIHPTAIIDENALLSGKHFYRALCGHRRNVTIGPGTIIGASAHIGAGTRIGTRVTVFPHAVLGLAPQDLNTPVRKPPWKSVTHTTIREFATMNRGTVAHGKTVVGSHCFLMA